MIVHRIPRRLAFTKWLQIFLGQPKGLRDTSINVVALLKIEIFEKVAAYGTNRDGIAVHDNTVQMRDCALNRHQPLTQVLVNAGIYLRASHKWHSYCRCLYPLQNYESKLYGHPMSDFAARR